MALKINVPDTNIGASFDEAYARIVTVNATKHSVSYVVQVHATEAARLSNKHPIRVDQYDLSMDEISGDLYPALYGHLKQQEFYVSGVDA
jgi:hypothetical protein